MRHSSYVIQRRIPFWYSPFSNPFHTSLFIYGIVPFAAQGQPLYIYTPVAYLETLALTSCLQVRILLCPSSLANRILSPALSRASGSFCLCDQISARASTSAVLPLRVTLSRSTQVITIPFHCTRSQVTVSTCVPHPISRSLYAPHPNTLRSMHRDNR